MSDADVSLIHDEDVLRRMWQQTEDFSKKKEIRAHMYKLREERLRNLYSPDVTIEGKGCDFTRSQGHSNSFADQSFQSMKSKEVRDAGSPPKEFNYRGQELKALSNAGWNVDSEKTSSDDGHTHTRAINATIEGRYDVDGGKGQFAAVDEQREAVTEYQDDNSSFKSNEKASHTSANEQVVQQSEDGTSFSSTKTSSSHFQSVSSARRETVPYLNNKSQTHSVDKESHDNSYNKTKKIVDRNSQENESQIDSRGELISSKVDYIDGNTKVVVEKRQQEDGTIITTTRRQTKLPTQTSKVQQTITRSQNQISKQSTHNIAQQIDEGRDKIKTFNDTTEVSKTESFQNNMQSNQTTTERVNKINESKKNIDNNDHKIVKSNSDQYQTTYQTDYTTKVSQELSPTHQAWASTLRSDRSSRTPTRASSPGTFKHSSSSIRNSISPDKLQRKPSSRGGSPSKIERHIYDSYDTYTNTYESNIHQDSKLSTKYISSKASTPLRGISPTKNIKNDETYEYIHDRSRSKSPLKKPQSQQRNKSEGPEQIPGYMQPTMSSKLSQNTEYHTKTESKTHVDMQHKNVDEETKMLSHAQNITPNTNAHSSTTRESPPKLTSCLRKSSSPTRRSPSPPKVAFQTKVEDPRKDIQEETISDDKTYKKIQQRSQSQEKQPNIYDNPHKEMSPSKIEINNKNQRMDKHIINHDVGTYDKVSSSSFREQARLSTSPNKNVIKNNITTEKSLINDTKSHSSDFLTKEIISEHNNRKSIERKRQLVTPSSSPTRQPVIVDKVAEKNIINISKHNEKDSSTGQSSPTTSVSDILYFSAPIHKNIVTDLDEVDYEEQINMKKRPETLDFQRSPSPSQKPCRSPTPEKKDKLPRKSSLKKTSLDKSDVVSPLEKPPTTFKISPKEEEKVFPAHKIVKKDRAESADNIVKTKTKPPLERRETYEERCRKILGMKDNETDNKINTFTKTISTEGMQYSNNTTTKKSTSREGSPTKNLGIIKTHPYNSQKEETKTFDISSRDNSPSTKQIRKSISREGSPSKSHTMTKTNRTEVTKSSKFSSRDNSPTKLKDILALKVDDNKNENDKVTYETKTDYSEKVMMSEQEQYILEKVQNSLKKLSPERSLVKENQEPKILNKSENYEKEKETIDKVNKPLARNSSPTKKPNSVSHVPKPINKSAEPSPKAVNDTKNKESITQHSLVNKFNKNITQNTKKSSSITKQNSFTTQKYNSKTTASTTVNKHSKNEGSNNNVFDRKSSKDNIIKKTTDAKVTRTASDISIKEKKASPQRVRSKPEILVNKVTNTNTYTKHNSTVKDVSAQDKSKSSLTEPKLKLSKPTAKSATALNNTENENDIIIDIQQAKSSRETTPDRICPTPVNFLEDIGTPRLPDEVSEPDDEMLKRTHHTIHETETTVDDIVEISEDEEISSTKNNINRITNSDECLLSVTDKVSKFSANSSSGSKQKDKSSDFIHNERIINTKEIAENLKSDDCMLSVSEKVNKFVNVKENTEFSNSCRDNYLEDIDKNTEYQDDYTKLSVCDKANMFIETAENTVKSKSKPSPKIERHNNENVDNISKSDECLLSVSDKVNKFIETAKISTETKEIDNKIYDDTTITNKKSDESTEDINQPENIIQETYLNEEGGIKNYERRNDNSGSYARETVSSHAKNKDYASPNIKTTDRTSTFKITTLRSSEAVKKAKAMFENIASTTSTQKAYNTSPTKSTKLTDIGVIKKSPITDSTIVLHPSIGEASPYTSDVETEGDNILNSSVDSSSKANKSSSPDRSILSTPQKPINYSSNNIYQNSKHQFEQISTSSSKKDTIDTSKIATNNNIMQKSRTPTKEDKVIEDHCEVSTRRGSGKFGVELRRTSLERSTISSERRRSSTEHHQPCIEDIFDLKLLEQMLEKVVGYEQRRRIRAQIRIAKKNNDHNKTSTTGSTNSTSNKQTPFLNTPKNKSPERKHNTKTQNTETNVRSYDEVENTTITTKRRLHSPDKTKTRTTNNNTKTSIRNSSPEKIHRTPSPSKTVSTNRPKQNRFNEYASAYMKKVGLDENEKIKYSEELKSYEKNTVSSSMKKTTERASSKDREVIHVNGNRTHSPESNQRQISSELLATHSSKPNKRNPSPEKTTTNIVINKSESSSKFFYDIEKKAQPKKIEEEKPSWISNNNLKKLNNETRTFSSKKVEDKKVHRSSSPSKVISRPIDVITSSYGPGPLDANGRPLFGIKALRNGASNYQVKGTVIRQEYHSRNGGEPEGSMSVTTYSTNPDDLHKLLQSQDDRPSRIHGLSAITTTKKFGGNTGTTLKEAHNKEDKALLDQFINHNRRVDEDSGESIGKTKIVEITTDNMRKSLDDRRTVNKRSNRKSEDRAEEIRVENKRSEDRKTLRQSSVKSLTEKFIKNTKEAVKSERSAYPKAGLILRTTSRDSNNASTDNEENCTESSITETTTNQQNEEQTFTQTVRTSRSQHIKNNASEKSFLDSSTKVTDVQDILTRMKNADIVVETGDTDEDTEARALLNKFLGATVLMAGMQNYVTGQENANTQTRDIPRASRRELDIDNCWDERLLKQKLEESVDYEQRRKLRARLRALMAEQEACASAVTEALGVAATETEVGEAEDVDETREEKKITITSSSRRDSSEKTVTTKTSKVIEMSRPAPKPVSPFAKFRQLEKQNSTNNPNSPKTPQSPGSPAQPYFKFTDPALQASAVTIKDRLLQWCRDKTREYENVKLENFSTSWADGLAFCALVHHFLPDAFDYSALTPDKRRHNFTLAFRVADEKAGIYPLLDVDDMVSMRKPDWKCVFTYVQAIHRRFKDN